MFYNFIITRLLYEVILIPIQTTKDALFLNAILQDTHIRGRAA